jgi:ribonuclease HII
MGVIGVDEVGRGPLAGPVLAAAVLLDVAIDGIADSKTLSAAERMRLDALIRACCPFALGAASVGEIDRIDIRRASLLAMRRAVVRLARRLSPLPPVVVDGRDAPSLDDVLPGCALRAVIGGDRSEPAIGAASIVAKVARDRLMARLALRHPGYGFERHAGYGTRLHLEALRLNGATAHHRRSFRPVRLVLEAQPPGPSAASI